MTLVREALELPGGEPPHDARVVVELVSTDELVPSVAYADDVTIGGRWELRPDGAGRWELDLEPTETMEPLSAYRVTITHAGRRSFVPTRWFEVPVAPGPYSIDDLEVDVPVGLPRYATVDGGHLWESPEMVGGGGEPDTSDWDHLVDGGGP